MTRVRFPSPRSNIFNDLDHKTSDRLRTLALLDACGRDGCTEAILLAHGFTVAQLVELANAGLSTATAERVIAGGRTIEVARLRITDAGRGALAN